LPDPPLRAPHGLDEPGGTSHFRVPPPGRVGAGARWVTGGRRKYGFRAQTKTRSVHRRLHSDRNRPILFRIWPQTWIGGHTARVDRRPAFRDPSPPPPSPRDAPNSAPKPRDPRRLFRSTPDQFNETNALSERESIERSTLRSLNSNGHALRTGPTRALAPRACEGPQRAQERARPRDPRRAMRRGAMHACRRVHAPRMHACEVGLGIWVGFVVGSGGDASAVARQLTCCFP
jgi:hypothetical protein